MSKSSPVSANHFLPHLPPKISICVAPDLLRVEKAVQGWLTTLRETTPKTELRRVQGVTAKEGALASLLTQESLFTPRTLVWLVCTEGIDARLSRVLTPCLKRIAPSHSLVISTSQLPTKTVAGALLDAVTDVITFPTIEGAARRAWICDELKTQGFTKIDDEGLEYLTAYLPNNLDQATQVLTQICLSLEPETPILLRHIEPFLDGTSSVQEFTLLDALLKTPAEIIRTIEVLFNQGSNPFLIINMVSRHFNTCLALRSGIESGKTPNEAAQSLNIQPWLLKRYAPIVSRTSCAVLRTALAQIVAADLRLKGVALSPKSIVDELCLGLAVGMRAS